MPAGALALDIDGTIDVADKKELQRLVDAARMLRIPRYINTARSYHYCNNPDRLTTSLVSRSKHHCLVSNDVPHSKTRNMHTIKKNARVADPSCVILIDDRPENIAHVKKNGFTGIQVDDRFGIQKETVDEAIETMHLCAANPNLRGTASPHGTLRRRARLIVAAMIAVLIIVFLCLL